MNFFCHAMPLIDAAREARNGGQVGEPEGRLSFSSFEFECRRRDI